MLDPGTNVGDRVGEDKVVDLLVAVELVREPRKVLLVQDRAAGEEEMSLFGTGSGELFDITRRSQSHQASEVLSQRIYVSPPGALLVERPPLPGRLGERAHLRICRWGVTSTTEPRPSFSHRPSGVRSTPSASARVTLTPSTDSMMRNAFLAAGGSVGAVVHQTRLWISSNVHHLGASRRAPNVFRLHLGAKALLKLQTLSSKRVLRRRCDSPPGPRGVRHERMVAAMVKRRGSVHGEKPPCATPWTANPATCSPSPPPNSPRHHEPGQEAPRPACRPHGADDRTGTECKPWAVRVRPVWCFVLEPCWTRAGSSPCRSRVKVVPGLASWPWRMSPAGGRQRPGASPGSG